MPNRILREGILTSQRMAKLGWAEEVFYRRLHSVVDDFGRYFADIGLLRAACYPRQLNKVSDSDVEKWLQATEKAALVRVYPAEDGERYLELLDFRQQVRAKASKFPGPATQITSNCVADAQQLPANAHLDVSGDGDVSEGVEASPQAAPTPDPKGSRLPADWVLPEEWRKWAEAERPDLEATSVACSFRDFWIAKPGKEGRKANWEATWRNWIRSQKQGSKKAPTREDYLKGAINYGR